MKNNKLLVAEYIRLQKYIDENDLKTQIELEDDGIVVYYDGAKTATWDVDTAKHIRTVILTNSFTASKYAKKVIKGQFELGEPVIAKTAGSSYMYASDVIGKRFELGESVISTNPHYACLYAINVINGRFKLGEPAISKDENCSYVYAETIYDKAYLYIDISWLTSRLKSFWHRMKSLMKFN